MIRLFFYCNEDAKKLLIIWTSMFWKHVIGLFVYLLVYWFDEKIPFKKASALSAYIYKYFSFSKDSKSKNDSNYSKD